MRLCLYVQMYGKQVMLLLAVGDPLHLPCLVEFLLSTAIVFLVAHGILLANTIAS